MLPASAVGAWELASGGALVKRLSALFECWP
jgi:hypothetical protein